MAKVKLNKLMKLLQGQIGGLVFRQRPDGTLLVSGAPSYRKGKSTPKQKAHQARFRQATQWAKHAAKVHPIYERLAAGTWNSAYNYALSDWFEAPVIHRLERAAGCIKVEASDNILVERVRVTVLDEHGREMEKGEAVRSRKNWWRFTSRAQGRTIVAEAWDLAGNVTHSSL